jgi:ribosomal protein L35
MLLPLLGLLGRVPLYRASALSPALLRVGAASSRGVKTKSSAKKRFNVKPNGTITRMQGGKKHLNMCKTRKHVNALGVSFWESFVVCSRSRHD